jgi:hypothetical protein
MSSPIIRLRDIAHARSGDKGNHANIAVIAYRPAGFGWLLKHLTADEVACYFSSERRLARYREMKARGESAAVLSNESSLRSGSLRLSRIERFEARNLLAFNFVLYDVLAGGASRSLRIDSQGKALGLALLQMELPIDDPVMARELMGRQARMDES